MYKNIKLTVDQMSDILALLEVNKDKLPLPQNYLDSIENFKEQCDNNKFNKQ